MHACDLFGAQENHEVHNKPIKCMNYEAICNMTRDVYDTSKQKAYMAS